MTRKIADRTSAIRMKPPTVKSDHAFGIPADVRPDLLVSPTSRNEIATAKTPPPRKSMFRSASGRRTVGSSRQMTIRLTMPIGMFTKKTQCQLA
jgi:hypothetical protein